MTAATSIQHSEIVLDVYYPVSDGRIVLRCDSDWDADIEADEISDQGQCATFRLHLQTPFRYLKPVWVRDNTRHWAQGNNYLILAHGERKRRIYPYFHEDGGCTVCDIERMASPESSSQYAFRVFTPPGYQENTLKRYPVLYLQDGQNVFFPGEASGSADWRIPETLSLLNNINLIDKIIAVGIYPHDREHDYSQPGYETYGRFLASQLKPRIDSDFRTLSEAGNTAIMGSSLGGVASLHVAWHWPELFGMAACLSSTFGWRDDLRTRIAEDPPRDIRIYLDSGWPQDNYEVTRDMHALLLSRGYSFGQDLLYFGFPGAAHNEESWALRSHIPCQFLFGNRQSTSSRYLKCLPRP